MSDFQLLAILGTVVYGFVNWLKVPIKQYYPNTPSWMYTVIQFVVSMIIILPTGINLIDYNFELFPFFGNILTAIAVGAESEIFYSFQRIGKNIGGGTTIIEAVIQEEENVVEEDVFPSIYSPPKA